jgi:hypothetical protein
VLIYGEPSAGKTSISSTANNVLLLDFDKGAHRSAFRQNVFVVESWKMIAENQKDFASLIAKYDTIVIDTADSMLEFMGVYAIQKNGKLATNKLQWYGAIKDMFTNFVALLKSFNKDVIFIAHVKEKDEGDVRIKRPAIMGGSYDKVLQTCDFVGFASFKGDRRVLNFSPSEYHVGKNSAKLDVLEVPDFNENRYWFNEIITLMKNSLNAMSESQRDTMNKLQSYSSLVLKAENLEHINLIVLDLKKESLLIKQQVWIGLEKKANELNLKFNKTSKEFENAS